MITRQDIEKAAKTLIRKVRGEDERVLIHPARDWFVILGLFVAGLIALTAFTGLLFLRVSSVGEGDGVETESEIQTIDRGALSDMLEAYRVKREQLRLLTE